MENEAVVRNWGEPTHEQINDAPRDYLHIATVISQCNFLHGKILTIIDASFTGTQNKAVKDLVRKSFREQMDWMRRIVRSGQSKPIISERKPVVPEGDEVEFS